VASRGIPAISATEIEIAIAYLNVICFLLEVEAIEGRFLTPNVELSGAGTTKFLPLPFTGVRLNARLNGPPQTVMRHCYGVSILLRLPDLVNRATGDKVKFG
jgi:hypothetical protein